MINYSTRDFATKEQLELYLLRQEKAFTPEVIKLFTDAGMLRRVVTQIWNKEQSHRVGIIFEYRDQEAYTKCQKLLEVQCPGHYRERLQRLRGLGQYWHQAQPLSRLPVPRTNR